MKMIKLFVLFCMIWGVGNIRIDQAAAEDPVYDWLAEDIVLSPAALAVNQDCEITVKIKNNSSQKVISSAGLSTYVFSFPNFIQSSMNYAAPSFSNVIKPNEYVKFVYKGKFSQLGKFKLQFSIDTQNELKEGKEDNNTITKEIEVLNASGLDIAVQSLSILPAEPLVNTLATMTIMIKNTGNVALVNYAGLLIDQDLFRQVSSFIITRQEQDPYPTPALPLDPGDSFKYVLAGYFEKTGNNPISVKIDQNNRLVEVNENNNATTSNLSVFLTKEERDDFQIASFEIKPMSSSSVMALWSVSEPLAGSVIYKEAGYSSQEYAAEDKNVRTYHRTIISNLKSNFSYYFKTKVINDSRIKETDYIAFQTPENNNIRLTVVPKAAVNNSESSAAIQWSTDLGATSFVYYKKNGIQNYSMAGNKEYEFDHRVVLEKLEPGSYDYYIVSSSTANTVIRSSANTFVVAASYSSPISSSSPGAGKISIRNIRNNDLYNKWKGRIIKTSAGNLWYLSPTEKKMYWLENKAITGEFIKNNSLKASNQEMERFLLGWMSLNGKDGDKDGLIDELEKALGTNPGRKDSDGDKYSDKDELLKGYSPLAKNLKLKLDSKYASGAAGKFLMQANDQGRYWYVNYQDQKKYFLGSKEAAFSILAQAAAIVKDMTFNQF